MRVLQSSKVGKERGPRVWGSFSTTKNEGFRVGAVVLKQVGNGTGPLQVLGEFWIPPGASYNVGPPTIRQRIERGAERRIKSLVITGGVDGRQQRGVRGCEGRWGVDVM